MHNTRSSYSTKRAGFTLRDRVSESTVISDLNTTVRTVATVRTTGERGVAMVSAAIVIPLLVLISISLIDLARIYLNAIFAEEIAILTAKMAVSKDPLGYAFPDADMVQFLKIPPGESIAITVKRQTVIQDLMTTLNFPSGASLPDKQKKVFNLAYGFATTLNPRMYFPIPEPVVSSTELGGRPNCTIGYRFAAGSELPNPFPISASAAYKTEVCRIRDRVYSVQCMVPLFSRNFLGAFLPYEQITITREAFAYQSGNICASGDPNHSFCAGGHSCN